MQTIYEAAGGRDGILKLAGAWHKRVLEDEVVAHAFSHGFHPQHTERYGGETSVERTHAGNGVHEEMGVDRGQSPIVALSISLADALIQAPHQDLSIMINEPEPLVTARDEEAFVAVAVEAVDLALL